MLRFPPETIRGSVRHVARYFSSPFAASPLLAQVFRSAASTAPMILDELERLFKMDERSQVIDEIGLKKLDREAEKLLHTKDVADGYIVHSAVAALKWDVEAAKKHVANAVRIDPSVAMQLNAVITFEFLNRADLAAPYGLRAAEMAPTDGETIEAAVTTLINSGDIANAARIQSSAPKEVADALTFDAIALKESIDHLGVTYEHVSSLMQIAQGVLSEEKRRIRNFMLHNAADPDGGLSVAFEFGFYGTLEDEFFFEARLADRLGELKEWNPNKISVNLTHVKEQYADSAG